MCVCVCVTDLFSLFASDLGGYAAREDIEAVLQILDGETPASLQKCFIEVSQLGSPSSQSFLLCKEMFGCLSLSLKSKAFRAMMVYTCFQCLTEDLSQFSFFNRSDLH